MQSVRSVVASILVLSVVLTPVWSATGPAFGTVIEADHARVGGGAISAGATVFGGDKLFTGDAGSLQLRAGSARFLLSGDSIAVLAKDPASPSASLTRGTAIFSTANSKAFVLHVGDMIIRPGTDQPTVAQVSVSGPRQLMVRSTRGSLTVAVDDDVRVIPEGMAYHIVLNPSEAELAAADASAAQGPAGSGTGNLGHSPRRAGRNRFIWYVIGAAIIVTGIALYEALESPSSPN